MKGRYGDAVTGFSLYVIEVNYCKNVSEIICKSFD